MTTPTPAVWSDGDPLMTAIAAAVWEQCATHPEEAVTCDDPRSIAAVAATVARQVLAPLAAGLPLVKGRCPACGAASLFLGVGGYPTCSRIDCPVPDAASTVLEQPASAPAAPAGRATDRRDRYAAALTSVWCQRAAEQVSAAPEEHCAVLADAAMAVADAEQRVKLGEQAEQYMARLRELAELVPDENAQPPADRATVLREAADFVGNDDTCDCGGCDTCIPRRLAAGLRRLADEAQPTEAHPTETEWVLEALWRTTDTWRRFGPARATRREADQDHERAVTQDPSRQYRIVRAVTTSSVEPTTTATEEQREPHPTEADLAHALNLLNQLPAPAATDDGDPICGDQYDDEACELEPEHAGAHCAGIVCWDYGRAPATAATEEPQPCPAKHGAHGRICDQPNGHSGLHSGPITRGGWASWDGDAP